MADPRGESGYYQPWMSRSRAGVKRSFWPNFFSRIVARLQWDPRAIDLAADAARGRSCRTSGASA